MGSFSKSNSRMSCARGIIKSEQYELQNNLLFRCLQRPLCEGKWAFRALPEGSRCTPLSWALLRELFWVVTSKVCC